MAAWAKRGLCEWKNKHNPQSMYNIIVNIVDMFNCFPDLIAIGPLQVMTNYSRTMYPLKLNNSYQKSN